MQKTIPTNKILLVLAAASLLTFSACSNSEKETPETSEELSDESIIFQALGYSVGQDILLADFSPEEREQILAGLLISAEGGEFANIDTLRMSAYKLLQDKSAEKELAAAQEESAVNKALAEEYFAELDKKEGVKKTESGLRYEITQEGSDVFAVNDTDTVNLHYHGTILDGTVFDSSVDRGQPVSFSLNGVIAGFGEGLKLVGEGGKITLYMPSDIAYGDHPRPGVIKAGMALIFEVEMIKVNP